MFAYFCPSAATLGFAGGLVCFSAARFLDRATAVLVIGPCSLLGLVWGFDSKPYSTEGEKPVAVSPKVSLVLGFSPAKDGKGRLTPCGG